LGTQRKQINPKTKMKKRAKHARTQTDDKAEQAPPQEGPPAPTPEQIRRRAHEVYISRGGAPGQDWDDWLQAEAELKAEIERRNEQSAQ
jgi:hypothetical protein